MRVAVVGAGINGLAAARALARRDHAVTVYEQFALDHTRGSSHGASRIFRLSYPELDWVQLAQQALPRWRELEDESGERLLELNGIIEFVRGHGEGSQRALEQAGATIELLDQAEVVARFPMVRPPDGTTAVFQAEAGIVRADKARRAFEAGARAHGAEVRTGTRVANLDDLDEDVVVVTAGSWAKDLLARAGIDLPVVATSETVSFFRLESDRPVPSVVDFKPGTRGHGMYALADPKHGLKLGIHQSGRPLDPDDPPGPDAELVELMREAVARYFPTADPEPAQVDTCLYTNTDDERFILERHGRVVVGSACSGHGFKFAPVVGERLADLADAIL
ncbi:MAG: FAD-dependent oxidoreductase [Acidobacteria bacterium]|nr:FAD-dependent oxidoreductase [Acidobacteriota bacterium]